MAEFSTSGRAIDLPRVLKAVETVVFIRYRRRHARGVPSLALIPHPASGGPLLLAVRVALTGAPDDGPDVSS